MGFELNEDQLYAIYDLENWWSKGNEQVFEISGGPGTGKAQPDDTLIPTPKGNRYLKNLRIGDYVYDHTGNTTKILGIYPQGKRRAYKVYFADGRSTICCINHLWTYFTNKNEYKTEELSFFYDKYKNRESLKSYKIPISKYIKTYGKCQKDCSIYANRILSNENIDIDEIINLTEKAKERIISIIMDRIPFSQNNKFYYIRHDNYEVLINIQKILFSMGIVSRIKEHNELHIFYNYHKGWVENVDYTYITKIEKLDYKCEMRCIYVDNKHHTYLTNDYIVTHNTTLVSYFIERLGLKLKNVLFVAFMGKAASVLQRKGLPAKTIHSAIYDYVEKIARDDEGKIILNDNGRPKMTLVKELKYKLEGNIKLIVVDEASMVDKKTAEDLLSFGIPVVALGDLDQLPPVFGNPYFLKSPDVVLAKIMRQAEGNPIVWLANEVRNGRPLTRGQYGKSIVMSRKNIKPNMLKCANIILTGTNRLRYNINSYYREEIKNIKRLEYPHVGEKIICRKNNWAKSVDGVYLTNGTQGTVEKIYNDTYDGKSMVMDFKVDFLKESFKNIKFDYKHLYAQPSDDGNDKFGSRINNIMEFAYAITVHASQGSQYDTVMYMHEDTGSSELMRKQIYTAITRAVEQVIIVF